MNILLTGASGFIGSYIFDKLSKKESIFTIGRCNQSITCDLACNVPDLKDQYFDKVIHAAGYAHIGTDVPNYEKKMFDINLKGTHNLLKALSMLKVKPSEFIFFSTVAVYGCKSGHKITEEFELKATDPYGVSKIEAEKAIINWCNNNLVRYQILRIPLVIGKNPPGNLKKMIDGIKSGKYFSIGSGKARKSMVLLDDLAQLVSRPIKLSGVYNITDDYDPTFRELELIISENLAKKIFTIPTNLIRFIGYLGDIMKFCGFKKVPLDTSLINKLTSDLTFSCDKAKIELNWQPHKVTSNFPI
jgi:nucleoside-diphosphate-sugar epimerase